MTLSKKTFSLSFCLILLTSFLSANISTYFSYSPIDLKKLESLNTSCCTTKKDLEQSDELILKATKDEPPSSIKILRLYAYLYVAQSEAIHLSHNIKGSFSVSLAPLNFSVLSLFFPESIKPTAYCEDPFSVAIADVIFKKIKERVDTENSQPDKYAIPKEKESIYNIGLAFTKLIPWYANPPTDYFPSPPSTSEEFWHNQVQKLKSIQQPLTSEKKKAIQFWAGTDADWRQIANQFLFKHNLPMPEIIDIRSSLMMGIYDSTIVGFSAKYQFLRMRPKEFDSSVYYEIPVPKHPSYPANHALLGWTFATILSSYLPAEKDHWDHLAEEAGMSRIWAGIHYPIDIDTGKEMGIKIGKKIVKENRKPISEE